MYIFFGIITMIATIVLEIFWLFLNGSSITEFYVFIGPFLVGAVVSGAMTKAMVKFNEKPTKIKVLICILMVIGTFTSINYTEYKVSTEGIIHTKWYYSLEDKQIHSFAGYIKYKLDNKELEIPAKRGGVDSVDSKGTPNYVVFFIQFITVILGGILGNGYFAKKYYCDECKKYYVQKTIFSINSSEICKISCNGNINVTDIDRFKKFVQSHKLKEVREKGSYVGILVYCDECKKGKLIIKKMILKEKDEEELYDYRQVIDVDAHFVKVILPIDVDPYPYLTSNYKSS